MRPWASDVDVQLLVNLLVLIVQKCLEILYFVVQVAYFSFRSNKGRG